ncbi:hypothetical protein H2200_002843 [Cladophialophora chaetospira]|uniref:Uncharacterized protein n=1 Tax=Cladophialophora chaetospira TaxID=386627 RepID=A0AA38XGB6_9EURO|nr:hypothetical protein H2200_002843 [Cladophialophora chaetospira]
MSSWPEEYDEARDSIDWSSENKSWVGLRRQLGQTGDYVGIFMDGPEDADGFSLHADRIRDLCNGTTLDSGQRNDDERDEEGQPFVAWLDERSHDNGARKYHGPLTAKELRRLLGEERFQFKAGPSQPDAERRLIFITDLDSSAMRALILTTSMWQTPGLRAALYRHVSFETSIGVSFPANGLSKFELSFHLPFYVHRASQTPRTDPRRDVHGNPLRHFQDISFLGRGSQQPFDFLYEAQTSCLLSGSNKWRWVSYCFVDTYFDGDDEGRETLLEYHYDKEAEHGINADPLTFGAHDADLPIWNAREYFLKVLEHRLTPIKREWRRVVVKVEREFRVYDKTEHHRLILSKHHGLPQDLESTYAKVRNTLNWVQQVMRLCNQLNEGLWKTVDAYDGFRLQHASLFVDIQHFPIDKIFDEFKGLRKTLVSLADRCDQCAIELQLDLEETTETRTRQMPLISATSQNSTEQIRLALRQNDLNAQTYAVTAEHLKRVAETNQLVARHIDVNAQTFAAMTETNQLFTTQIELNKQTNQMIKDQLRHVEETSRLALQSSQLATRLLQVNDETNNTIKGQLEVIRQTLAEGQTQRQLTERSGREAKVFSWIMMIFVSPVALAAGIFSMQGNVIPFIRPSLGWFVGLVLAFILLQVAVHITVFRKWKGAMGVFRRNLQVVADWLSTP